VAIANIALTMLLIRRSPRAANAVRTVSPNGEMFVAFVVGCMMLSALGDAIDPTLLGDAGLESVFFDVGELSVIAIPHWHLVQLLLAGAVAAGIVCAMRTVGAAPLCVSRPGPHRALGKIPIVTPATH